MTRQGFIVLPLVFATSIGLWFFGRPEESPPPPAPPQNEVVQQNLEKYLTVEAALLGVVDDMSLYFKDLSVTKEVSIQPSKSWIPASTIKAFVVLEAFRQRRLGMIDFSQSIPIAAQNVVPTELETEDCPRLREGAQATIKELVECMVVQSDNTAYNTLLDILDRRNINATLQSLGFTETVVGEKLNLDDTQYAKDLTVAGRQSNTTTVKDFANLFDLLYGKKIPQADEILEIFKHQQINTMIPALLPPDTVVAHKTGDWAPIYHDGGVVYKPNDPFILTIFTHSNDPSVLAKLARVAYWQNASVVGSDAPQPKKTTGFDDTGEEYTISLTTLPTETQVLAAETGQKFPAVTAQDLGVTLKDLTIDQQDLNKVPNVPIGPGSLLYAYKRQFDFIKSLVLQATGKPFEGLLSTATDRIAETKTVLRSGNFALGQQLLDQSEKTLATAVTLANKDGEKEAKLAQIKNVNDLHYAVLADVAKTVPPDKKEQFIDMAYSFYQKNNQEVKAPVQNSLLANPLRQQPIVGTIKDIQNGSVTVQFTSGQEKKMTVNDLTPIRQMNQQTIDPTAGSLKVGSKIAIIGQTTNEGTIAPQFILRDLPKEVPDKHEGVVIEINPKKKTLEILNNSGKRETVTIDDKTVLQGKSTSVSLDGIHAGSYIQIFGQEVTPKISSTVTPTGIVPSTSLTPKPSGTSTVQPGVIQLVPSPVPGTQTPKQGVKGPLAPTSVPAPGSTAPETVIHATTVTVTKNSSGKNERVSPSSSAPKKSAPSKPQNTPAPKKKTSIGAIFAMLLKEVRQKLVLLFRFTV